MNHLVLSQLGALTRQFGRVGLNPSPSGAGRILLLSHIDQCQLLALRYFASPKKNSSSKKKSSSKKNAVKKPANTKSRKEKIEETATPQHLEWVKFQQSIAVEGFETGQTVKPQSTKKTRGGKAAGRGTRLTDVEERFAERRRLTAYGGGEYPPMRYSDEETERLLAEAYGNIPPRAGKRGTRNLKRQHVRWHLVRKIRKKYKKQLAAHQVRKMALRSKKIKEVKQVLAEAPAVVQLDREYQAKVYRQWVANMVQDQESA
jgi:hypothetical protein